MEERKSESEAPLLFSLKKKNVHQVPEGFFREMEKDIRRKYPRAPHRFNRLKRWLRVSLAAAFVLFLLLSGAKILADKNYIAVETERSFYNITDGNATPATSASINIPNQPKR